MFGISDEQGRRLMMRVLGVVGVLSLLCILPRAAAADVIELKIGQYLEGTVTQVTQGNVILEVGNQTITVGTDSVRAIYFGHGPSDVSRPDVPPPGPSRAPSAADVVRAMAALQEVVGRGTSLQEYESKVNVVKLLTGGYVAQRSSTTRGERDPLQDALRYYELAAGAWRNHATRDTVWLKRDAVLSRCPAYADFAEAMRAKGEGEYLERTRSYLVISDDVIPVLWACGADAVAQARQLLAPGGRESSVQRGERDNP